METIMKSFKDYLTESKKPYEFKVKIAGEIPADFATNLKVALSKFRVESISKAKRTPIQESPIDFPNVKFTEVTVFDLAINYPSNSVIVHEAIVNLLGCESTHVVVRTIGEEAETALNTEHLRKLETMTDKEASEALLNQPYAPQNHQDLVGEEHKLNFLKELGADKHGLKEYTGVNDQLFHRTPTEKTQGEQSAVTDKSGMGSPVGTHQQKLTPQAAARKNGIGSPLGTMK